MVLRVAHLKHESEADNNNNNNIDNSNNNSNYTWIFENLVSKNNI